MFAIVDIAVIVLVLALLRTGWKRGFVFIVLDLVGFVVAVVLTVGLYTIVADFYRSLGAPDGWAIFAGAITVFAPVIAIVAVIGMRLSRFTWLPGVHVVNRLLGVGFGALFGIAIAVTALLVLQIAPLPSFISDPIRRSTAARVVVSSAPPVLRGLAAISPNAADAYLIHLRWTVAWAGDPPDGPVRYSPTSEATVSIEAERDIVRRLNETRTAGGRGRLATDTGLRDAARRHARDAAAAGELDATLAGTRPVIVTLAPTPRLAHDGVMRAGELRDIVLSDRASRIGVGAYETPKGLVVALVPCVGC